MEGISFGHSAPTPKIAPVIIAGAALVGQAAVGAAVAWGVNRGLDKAFPKK